MIRENNMINLVYQDLEINTITSELMYLSLFHHILDHKQNTTYLLQ